MDKKVPYKPKEAALAADELNHKKNQIKNDVLAPQIEIKRSLE